MHLAPREIDKLLLHGAGSLAQKRLARGTKLNHPESVALIATVLLELVRDGKSVAELMDVGRRILGRVHVMPGIAEMIADVQVEGTFEDGTKLVTVHDPIATDEGDLALALHGSFLPIPDAGRFASSAQGSTPGEVLVRAGTLTLNEGRAAIEVVVKNVGDRPIQVGSHYPFDRTNSALDFDRPQTRGRRLDIPAGTATRFEPGEEKTVRLGETR